MFLLHRKLMLVSMLAYALSLPTAVLAAQTSEDTIKTKLNKSYPDVAIEKITKAPIPGWYEVLMGGAVIYVSPEGRFLFHGDLIDLDNDKANLAEIARAKPRIDAIKKLNPKSFITFAPAKPKHHIYVFTDIDCGYCQKFHQEVPRLNDLGVAVHYLAFPRAGLGSPTYQNMVSIWCAKDKKAALTAAKQGQAVPSKSCDHPIESHMRLVRELSLTGTPALIFANGELLPGYVPADELMRKLESIK